MDFTPAMPDIVVHNNPDDKAKGKDTQLKRAVDELLKDLQYYIKKQSRLERRRLLLPNK